MVASVASFLAVFLSVGGLELVAAQQAPDSHAMKRRFVPKQMKRHINYQRSDDGKPLDDFLEKAGLGTKTTGANPPPPPPTETTLPAVVVTLSIDKDGKTHTISGPLPAGATIASATTNVVTIVGPGAPPAAPTSHKDTLPAPSEKEAAPSDSTTHLAPTTNKEGPDAPAASSSSSPAAESKDGGILDDVKSFFGVSSSTDSTEASSTTSDSKPAPSSDSQHAPSAPSSASVTPTPESTDGSFLDDVKSFFGDTSSTDSVSATSSASDSKLASSAASGSSVTPTASSTDGGLLDDFKSFFGDSSSTGSPSSGTPPASPLSSTADASTTKAIPSGPSSTSTPGPSSFKTSGGLLDAFTDLFDPDTPSSSTTHAPSTNPSSSGLSATPTSVPLPSTSSGLFNLPSDMSSLLGWTSALESPGPQSTLPPGAATSSALFPGASSGSTGSSPFTLISPSVPTTTPGGASSTESTSGHGSTTGGSTALPTAKPTGKPTSPGSPTSAPSTAPPTHPPSSTSTETPTPTSTSTTETSSPPPETTEAPTPTPSDTDDWVDNTIIYETQTHTVQDPAATQTTSESTSQPTALPGSITPPTFGNIPENSTLIQLGFTRELSYDFVATHTMSSSQIFRYIPLGLQHALRLAADQVAMFAIQPYGNESRDGYLTTLAMAYVPWDQIDTLRKYLHNPISPLYEQPSESEKRLFSLIDPSIPLLVSGEPAAGGGGSSGQSGSSNGGSNGSSDEDDSQTDSGDAGASSSSSTKASSVGIGCGVVAGAAAYGAGMFWLARRYRKKRQLHQRSSSTVDQQSEGRDAAGRLSPNSQSSRGMISAPVMAENSLGWN